MPFSSDSFTAIYGGNEDPQEVDSSSSSSLHHTENDHEDAKQQQQQKKTDSGGYGLMLSIAFLVPLFIINASKAAVPELDCSKAHSSRLNACKEDARKRGETQYIGQLILAFLGLITAFSLARYKVTSRAAVMGLAYGSMFGLLVAVAINSSKFNSSLRMLIIGVVVVALVLLPRVADAGLMASHASSPSRPSSPSSHSSTRQASTALPRYDP